TARAPALPRSTRRGSKRVERGGDDGGGDAAEVPGGDGAFAVADDFDVAVVVDGADGGVVGGVLGPAGDVLRDAVVEVGEHFELGGVAGLEDEVRGLDLDG